MAIQLPRVGVRADLHVHVSRNGRGTLADGARAVVTRIDAVHEVGSLRVTSFRPGLNAVSTDVRVDLTLALDGTDPDRVADALRDGVGVHGVDVHDVGPPD